MWKISNIEETIADITTWTTLDNHDQRIKYYQKDINKCKEAEVKLKSDIKELTQNVSKVITEQTSTADNVNRMERKS